MTNPPVDSSLTLQASTQVTAEVLGILERSCSDCHSSDTVWPWYSQIAPVSWWIVDHVKEARDEFDMSNFGEYPPKRAAHKLEELCEMMEEHEMPLTSFLILHPEAKLSESDRETLCNWASEEREFFLAQIPDSLR